VLRGNTEFHAEVERIVAATMLGLTRILAWRLFQ
jgi:hypothetical protein